MDNLELSPLVTIELSPSPAPLRQLDHAKAQYARFLNRTADAWTRYYQAEDNLAPREVLAKFYDYAEAMELFTRKAYDKREAAYIQFHAWTSLYN